MKLQPLEYFCAIVEEGSYTRAAQRMFVSRQAMSQTVRQLESDLGCQLLAVTDHGVLPTPLGKELYTEGAALLEQARELEHRIRHQAESASPLDIAVSDTLLPSLEPTLLQQLHDFSSQYPKAVGRIEECPNDRVPDLVREGTFDFGFFLGEQTSEEGLTLVSYRRLPMVFSMSVRHPLAKASDFSVKDLDGEVVLVPGPPERFLPVLKEECRQAGAEPAFRVVTSGIEGAYLVEKECVISCDIDVEYYSTKLITKKPAKSMASLAFQMAFRPEDDNYLVRLLREHLSGRLTG